MKASPFRPRLVRELRSLFGVLRWLMVLGLVAAPITLISLPTLGKNPWRNVGEVQFVSTSPGIQVRHDGRQPAGINLSRLSGTVMLDDADAAGRELVTIVRWTHFLSLTVTTLLLIAVFEILWRLCRHVERGNIFTTENLKLVRLLGASLVAITIVDSMIETWKSWRIGGYIERHVTFEGLQTVAPLKFSSFMTGLESVLRHFHFNASLFITGMLVIALAEVFRQGLVLKQETDLTV